MIVILNSENVMTIITALGKAAAALEANREMVAARAQEAGIPLSALGDPERLKQIRASLGPPTFAGGKREYDLSDEDLRQIRSALWHRIQALSEVHNRSTMLVRSKKVLGIIQASLDRAAVGGDA